MAEHLKLLSKSCLDQTSFASNLFKIAWHHDICKVSSTKVQHAVGRVPVDHKSQPTNGLEEPMDLWALAIELQVEEQPVAQDLGPTQFLQPGLRSRRPHHLHAPTPTVAN